jgi:hypothetical protein
MSSPALPKIFCTEQGSGLDYVSNFFFVNNIGIKQRSDIVRMTVSHILRHSIVLTYQY